MRQLLIATAVALSAAQAGAQGAARVITGQVTTRSNPLPDVNVFIRETLEGTLTDSLGRFRIIATRAGSVELVAQRIGFQPLTVTLPADGTAPLALVLEPVTNILAPVTAVASRFAAGEERGATLTTLDVVSTAGTTADIGRAIQTLPGTQAVDEGTALFVRGGDYNETTVLLDDAVLRTPFGFESPNGTFMGTVDPFLLDGIVFAAGGFGARYGNALSGIASLRTQGRPLRSGITVGAGLAAVSASASAPITPTLGIRIAANQTDTRLMMKVNGSTQPYDPAPRGFDRSGSVSWNYRPTGEIKLFAITQRTTLGTEVADASHRGTFDLLMTSGLAVANWSDSIGRLRPFARLSYTAARRHEDYGAFQLSTRERFLGAAAGADLFISEILTIRTGVEQEISRPLLEGAVPRDGYDKGPEAPTILFASSPRGTRTGIYGESDFVVGSRTRIVAGVRRDDASLTGRSTVDPRISAAVTLFPGIVATGAYGIYHQLPDPISLDAVIGDPSLPSMRATHAIAGIQLGSDGTLLRIEAYDKHYRDLVQFTRDYDAVGGGSGRARGIDVFAAGGGWRGMRWRMSTSMLSSRRTDPHTGIMASTAFEIPRTSTMVIQQAIPGGWQLGITRRAASGKPYTPVESAEFDAAAGIWVPTYGVPNSSRLPAFERYDVGLTHLRRVRAAQAVLYLSVNNVLDRENLLMYRYSPDFTSRIPIRSLFKRTVYLGASFSR